MDICSIRLFHLQSISYEVLVAIQNLFRGCHRRSQGRLPPPIADICGDISSFDERNSYLPLLSFLTNAASNFTVIVAVKFAK